ncbi:MAG: hypothetical protein FJZ47_10425 [Candidatus Tectomicrobia bacterium]|uniref:Aminoglycoside phosphotransferase domain-containing protein n=1 Tax=Tectimicrobiota bacterium TaxID=2528274 RepID=A0A938B400_UNCTE|nr:hypothetical protein [Candidatus Tectomicrobia bacterium]
MGPAAICRAFSLPPVHTIQPVGSGLLHATYQVTTSEGFFVLQRLHAAIPDLAIADMQAVTSYLAACGMQVPTLLLTQHGEPYACDAQGERWRMYPWLDGQVVDSLPHASMARAAGRLVGQLHHYLAACNYVPQGSIPHFHDTAFILVALADVQAQLPEEARSLAESILTALPPLLVMDEPQQLIHGDLKISNILFDAQGRASGLLDFDTLICHARAVDLGDALRSWCNRTSEDDPQATCDLALFDAAVSGYAEGFGTPAGASERARYATAARHIALELAARFLIDVVHDSYFGYDATRYPHRRAHNLARARGQYHLAQTIPWP